jgi:hypothetical protein
MQWPWQPPLPHLLLLPESDAKETCYQAKRDVLS